MVPRVRSSWSFAVLFLALACASEDPAPGPSGGAGGAGAEDCSGLAQPIAPGVGKDSANGYHFELGELVPANPVQTSSSPGNHWIIHLTNGAGEPVIGATMNITTFMPVHMHPGPPAAVVEIGDGDYSVEDLFFTMPGLWRITLSAAPEGSSDRASVELMMCLRVASG